MKEAYLCIVFFFQAEDGIRDGTVTGVQTCALPISWFAGRLAEMVSAEGAAMAADVVVPVPLHRERERERGYNQPALLSNPLARSLRLPHKAVLLVRTRARPDKQV